jgi:hypothetical protein
MSRKKTDTGSGETSEEVTPEPGPRRISGKTEDEWIEQAMSIAGYDPLLFIGLDREEAAKLIERFRPMHIAIMEIRAMFGNAAASKVVFQMYSSPFVDRGQVMLRQIQGGGKTQRSIEGPASLLERILSGDQKPPPRQVTAKDVTSAQERYNWAEENHGITGAR